MTAVTHFNLSIVHFILIFRRKIFYVLRILAPWAGLEPATLCLEGTILMESANFYKFGLLSRRTKTMGSMGGNFETISR